MNEEDPFDELAALKVEDLEGLDIFHASTIGRLRMAVSNLEVLMKFFVSHLIGDFRTGQLVTTNMRVQTLMALWIWSGTARED